MNEKKPDKKSPYKETDKVRVRKSYYTFSEEYPADRFHITRRKKRRSKRLRIQLVSAVIGFVALLCLSYFVVSTAMEISKAPIDSSNNSSFSEEINVAAKLKENGVRALYMPYTKLSDKNFVNDFVYEIQRKNCNCVVIDFKTQSGKLAYSSLLDYAIAGRCNLFDNDTVRQVIDTFNNNGITVIAGIYCFEDSAVAESNRDLAVKYMDTDVNWRNSADENGGSWLNPFSKNVRKYIADVISELYSMNIKGFLLHSVQFPDGAATGATYPGETKTGQRNLVLKNFVSSLKSRLPEDAFIIVSQGADDASKGNNDIYFGPMGDISSDALAVISKERDPSIVLTKKDKFISVISIYSQVSSNFPEKIIVPIIETDEYSKRYIRQMKRNAFTSYIIYDGEGNY